MSSVGGRDNKVAYCIPSSNGRSAVLVAGGVRSEGVGQELVVIHDDHRLEYAVAAVPRTERVVLSIFRRIAARLTVQELSDRVLSNDWRRRAVLAFEDVGFCPDGDRTARVRSEAGVRVGRTDSRTRQPSSRQETALECPFLGQSVQ